MSFILGRPRRPLGDLTSDELIAKRKTLTNFIDIQQTRGQTARGSSLLGRAVGQLDELDKFAPQLAGSGSPSQSSLGTQRTLLGRSIGSRSRGNIFGGQKAKLGR